MTVHAASRPRRLRVVVAAVVVILAGSASPATAIAPPEIDPRALVRSAPVAPPEPTEQRTLCTKPLSTSPTAHDAPPAQALLDLPSAWRFSRGAGQRIAVIDTGVTPHPRLRRLTGGGDYVSGSTGLTDCDAHGTLVAGILAAAPSEHDGFSGVAPDATLISIRQSSGAYAAKSARRDDTRTDASVGAGYGTVRTLAYAVTRAVDLGATVINISEVACAAASTPLGDRLLGAAVRDAYERDVVVVVAAGNLTTNSGCRQQNPTPVPAGSPGWDTVTTAASPAWFTPYVLTVGAVGTTGSPADFSLRGPWVSVAAPGTDIVSLSSTPGASGLVDALPGNEGSPTPIRGTSFAAPFVAGTAALVRARFPELSAGEVIDRIVRTAHGSGSGHDDAVGFGVVDPVAALTARLPASEPSPVASRAIPAPTAAPPVDHSGRDAALIGLAVCAAVIAAVLGLALPHRRFRRFESEEF